MNLWGCIDDAFEGNDEYEEKAGLMDQRPITTCLMKRIGKRSQRGRFSGADFRADYLRLEYYWNQYQGVVPLLGTKPSPDPVLKWPECDQNGAIGPLGDNKGRVDTWAQKWDENAPKKGDKKSGRHHSVLKRGKFLVPEDL